MARNVAKWLSALGLISGTKKRKKKKRKNFSHPSLPSIHPIYIAMTVATLVYCVWICVFVFQSSIIG